MGGLASAAPGCAWLWSVAAAAAFPTRTPTPHAATGPRRLREAAAPAARSRHPRRPRPAPAPRTRRRGGPGARSRAATPAPAPAPAAGTRARNRRRRRPKPDEAAASKPPEPGRDGRNASGRGRDSGAGARAGPTADNNPFAVFSETQAAPPPQRHDARPASRGDAAGRPAAEVPPQEVPPADAPPAAEGDQRCPGIPCRPPPPTAASRKQFTNPMAAANAFLAAIKEKDLNKIAQATALRAATESKNQKLFQLILSQELAQEDLDELAKKLAGFHDLRQQRPQEHAACVGVTVTKTEGTSIMRRTITMRHEKAGWKVQDIGGEGELEKPIIMPRMGRGGMGGGRRR